MNYIGELVIDPERGLGIIIGEDRDSVVVGFKDRSLGSVTLLKSEIEQSFGRFSIALPPSKTGIGPISKLFNTFKTAHPSLSESEVRRAIHTLLARIKGRTDKEPKLDNP